MTKKEREAIQDLINELSQLRDTADKAFNRLQDLNKTEGTGHRWCCAQTNAIDLLKCGKDYMYLYDKYVEAEAKSDMLTRLGSKMADLGFWKK